MWKWAQGAVASVTGAVEPEYGAEAFQSVDSSVGDGNPYSPLTRDDYKWIQPSQSHVETQTFYYSTSDESGGYYGFCQLIHSNPINLSYTSQFTFLLLKRGDPSFKVWTSAALENHGVTEDGINFKADGFDIILNDSLDKIKFTSVVSEQSQVDLEFSAGPTGGFKIGDSFSRYGTDQAAPWGLMRHIFWPRCSVNGTIIISGDKRIQLSNSGGMYIMALQGMKPHHAAARWNFLNFQGPRMSVIVMEFVTPVSYGSGRSSIGAVILDDKIVSTSIGVKIEHQDAVTDDVGWPAPGAIKFELDGPKVTTDGNVPEVHTEVWGKLKNNVDRLDVLGEIPAFVKRVAAGISGARPFIYQYNNELEASVTLDGQTHTERGWAFSEATFIS